MHARNEDAAIHERPRHDPAPPPDDAADTRSLGDDLEALIEDAKTYLDAELSYQKTRAGFVADRVKKTVAFGVVAAYLAVLATIGLTVGLIIALTPLITAWGATAVVVLGLLLGAYLFVRKAAGNWQSMMSAMKSGEEPGDHG
ncbi:phage holin family protein [Aurantiacibacter poecillastricola]|uniref:phage holin family protein n=1 Tax=Aurantiacibacter poecillastricola TaxID=3064385 RepID=UPI00273FF488|nr:phage holin family protein [Aurantiacibacter sp. 219JJ12-13]MDP5261954.1 phage holin family protein [Aurantiacibacter sp. 219JJ12-13]